MLDNISRPEFVKEEHLQFLNELRESGTTNMFGASLYLVQDFPELNKEQSMKVLTYWMETFEG